MGTDISMYTEVRKAGRWELAEPLERNDWWEEGAIDLGPEWIPKGLYSVRNYELFAILANVCNPIRSSIPFESICQPRGLPTDLSPQLHHWHAQCESSFGESWLLLEELIAFDWHGKQIARRGVVDPKVAHLFPAGRRGFPFAEWPKGLMIAVANHGVGVEVTWTDTYAEAVGDEFMNDTLNTLRSFGPPKDVRIVVWFDH
jgi:hypothetical protein